MTDNLGYTMRSEMTDRLIVEGADAERLRGLVQFALEQFSFAMLYLLDEPSGTSWDDGFEEVGPHDT